MAVPSPEGPGKAGPGRTPGIPNKSTSRAREAIAALVEEHLDNMAGWLERIAAKDPLAAMKITIDLLEFHLPKLARIESINPVEQERLRRLTDEELQEELRKHLK